MNVICAHLRVTEVGVFLALLDESNPGDLVIYDGLIFEKEPSILAKKRRTKSKFTKKYRTTKRPEYKRSLVRRGNFAILISNDVFDSWKPVGAKGIWGGQSRYPDNARLGGISPNPPFQRIQNEKAPFRTPRGGGASRSARGRTDP